MIKTIKWIEREFEFNFSAGIFPCIVERLRGTPARLEELLKNINESRLRIKNNGSWSILEHAGHLIDLEPLGEKRLKEFLNGTVKLSPADMTNKKTYEADYNTWNKDEILKEFRKQRLLLVNKLENLKAPELSYSAIHPRLNKKIRLVDWTFFVAEHDDHHLARITELANETEPTQK
jgi:hypothetical protein